MKTILIPVDFTATTENAVNFAAAWGMKYGYERIILLKTIYESVFEYIGVESGVGYGGRETLDLQRQETKWLLRHLGKQITEKTAGKMMVTTIISELPLIRALHKLLNSKASPELIVLGSDNLSASNGSYISSNIIRIARTCSVKVLIVPHDCIYRPIRNALVPCDLSKLTRLGKLDIYKFILKDEGIRLRILNVNPNRIPEDDKSGIRQSEDDIHAYFGDILHDIQYTFDKNIINGILSFTSLHKTELIIALPGKHSFLYYLTRKSILEGIYLNTNDAVLILK